MAPWCLDSSVITSRAETEVLGKKTRWLREGLEGVGLDLGNTQKEVGYSGMKADGFGRLSAGTSSRRVEAGRGPR